MERLKRILYAENTKFLWVTLVIYILVILFYHEVSQGLENKNFYLQVRRYIPCMLVLYLLQYFTKGYIASKYFISHVIVGSLWIVVYPLLYDMTYRASLTFYTNHQDMVFGLYLIALLSSLHYLLYKVAGRNIWTQGFISIVDTLLTVIPIFEIIYYILYKVCISPFGLMAIYQTDLNEAIEFIHTYVGYVGIAVVVAAFAVIFVGFYRCNSSMERLTAVNPFKWKNIFGNSVVFIAMMIYLPFSLFPRVTVIESWTDVRTYFESLQTYKVNHEEQYNSLQVNQENSMSSKVPGTFIIVIGESESRNFMSAYSNVERDTTPWLRSKLNDPNFIVFQNAYTSWTQTVPALERALTEVSQYNQKQFNESLSVIDVAKKLGYTTNWFSNQGVVGAADTPITLVANLADHAEWTAQSIDMVQYDDSLLDFLPQVDVTKNNFIVIHLMGSHQNYKNRYPPEFTKWGDHEANIVTDDYDNAVLHTDTVVSKIFEYAKAHLNLQAMVYFADHGEGVVKPRNPDVLNYAAMRIPMYLYLSNQYMKAYPERTRVLKANKEEYFTNDMIYDTVCGMLNSNANRYDAKQDFSSDKYGFSRDNLTTMLGRVRISEDPDIPQD